MLSAVQFPLTPPSALNLNLKTKKKPGMRAKEIKLFIQSERLYNLGKYFLFYPHTLSATFCNGRKEDYGLEEKMWFLCWLSKQDEMDKWFIWWQEGKNKEIQRGGIGGWVMLEGMSNVFYMTWSSKMALYLCPLFCQWKQFFSSDVTDRHPCSKRWVSAISTFAWWLVKKNNNKKNPSENINLKQTTLPLSA